MKCFTGWFVMCALALGSALAQQMDRTELSGQQTQGLPDPQAVIQPDTMYAAWVWAVNPIPVAVWAGNFDPLPPADSVDLPTVRVDETIIPQTASILPDHEGFIGPVLYITFDGRDYVAGLGPQWDTSSQVCVISGQFLNGEAFAVDAEYVMIGHLLGDLNLDGAIDVLDLTYLVRYLFGGGPEPPLRGAADMNQDSYVNILDLTSLVRWFFSR